MEILEFRHDDVHILGPGGKLDALSAPELQAKLGQVIADGATKVLLDAVALEYMSSSGIRVLATVQKTLDERGGRLVLCALQAPVQKVLDLTGLTEQIEVFPSRSEALAAMCSPSEP